VPAHSIVVRPKAKRAIAAGHPWVMIDSLVKPSQPIPLGQVVDLIDAEGKPLAKGLWNPNSKIAVRCYGFGTKFSLDAAFFIQRVQQACDLRDRRHETDNGLAQRLVFSEGDQLSGLIVDRFRDYLVVHQTSAALSCWLPAIVESLAERYRPRGILHLVDAGTAALEGMEETRAWLIGESPKQPIEIVENDLRWLVDLEFGQKTGYYLDQRENRSAVADWISPAARVLDVCTYVGGFALTIAKRHPNTKVLAFDSSPRALVAAQHHAELNGISNVSFERGDFKQHLEKLWELGQRFDAIVLDPPKLAGSRDSIDRAMRAYHRLNHQAVRLIEPGGILATCSCSGRVSRQEFWDMLRGVSKHARREIQLLEQRGPAWDHPVPATCPETDYLKCFICRVL
jgi:23S rRNA (cytosine1962-C5)-methyltransferase